MPTSEQLQAQYAPAPMQPQPYQVQVSIPVQLQPEQAVAPLQHNEYYGYIHGQANVQGNQYSVNSYPPQNGGYQNGVQVNQQLLTYQNGNNNGVYQLPTQ